MGQQARIPVDIVLAPEWWNKHTGITFDRDFFFHPLKRWKASSEWKRSYMSAGGNMEIDVDAAFHSKVYKDFLNLTESLKSTCGYLTGDVNWGGVLNIAMDLRGD